MIAARTSSRAPRKGPEVIAWVLWGLAVVIVLVPTTMAMGSPQLTLDQQFGVVIQAAALGLVVVAPSVYFWRRGGGRGHIDGLLWSGVVVIVVAITVLCLGPAVVWHALTMPIPYAKIF